MKTEATPAGAQPGTSEKTPVDATATPAKPEKPLKASIAERLAQAKVDVAAEAKKPAAAKPDADAKADKDGKPGDEKKPEDATTKQLRDGLARVAEREAKVTEDAAKLKTERAAFEAERTGAAGKLKRADDFEAACKAGNYAAAFQLVGLPLQKAIELYADTFREPTEEERVQRLVDERLAAERKRLGEEDEATKTKDAETAAAKWEADIKGWKGQAVSEFAAHIADFDMLTAFEATADDVWQRAVAEYNATKKLPTAIEALRLLETDLRAKAARSKSFRPAEVPGTKTETVEDKKEGKAGDTTPKTLTPGGAATVPLRREPKAGKRPSAQERLREAKREAGIS